MEKLYRISDKLNTKSVHISLTDREYNLLSVLNKKGVTDVRIMHPAVPYVDLNDTENCRNNYSFKKM